MDLLEYQGKQLFQRHGVPVSPGAPATTVDEALAAADEIGYPVVVKAQVLIGGGWKGRGRKIAHDRRTARPHPPNNPRTDNRAHNHPPVSGRKAAQHPTRLHASPVL